MPLLPPLAHTATKPPTPSDPTAELFWWLVV
jgi:hypothetical protein